MFVFGREIEWAVVTGSSNTIIKTPESRVFQGQWSTHTESRPTKSYPACCCTGRTQVTKYKC